MTLLLVLLQPANAGVCPTGGDAPNAAWVGKDSATGVACAAGFYNPGCADTSGGTFSTCYQCPEGYSCTASAATLCAAGNWSPLGVSSCSACPAGMYCQPTQTPKRCPYGFYDSGNTCAIAPSGSYVNSATMIGTTAVASPFWATPGSWIQNQVPAGYKLISTGHKPIECAQGWSFDSTAMTCTICPAGSYCPDPQTAVIACPDGTYQNLQGQTSCVPCPPGYSCATKTAIPTICSIGQFSLGYAMSCTTCPAGYQCLNDGQAPTLCPIGTASVAGDQVCTALTAGPQSSLTVKTTTACSAGSYFVYEPFYGRSICRTCPVGFMCPTATGAPIQCASGTYSSTAAAATGAVLPPGATACQTCPVNFYCPLTTVGPLPCPTGAVSIAGQTSCVPATTPSCTNTDGAAQFAYPNPLVCIDCPEGFACPDVYAAPIRCIQGFYSDTKALWCKPCERGFECPTPYFSDRVACTGTEYSRTLMAQNCPLAPSKMAIVSASDSNPPTWCDQGSYSPLGAYTCTVCPLGQICPGDNLPPYTCTNTMPGEKGSYGWYSRAGELHCFPKMMGYTSDQGPGPSGSANWDTTIVPGKLGMQGQGPSLNCPPGHECLFPMMHNWVSCPPGTHSTNIAYGCMPCPEGKVCPLRQSQYQTLGADSGRVTYGFYSPFGTHNEMVVPAGYFSDSANNYMLTPCKYGQWSSDGTDFVAGTTGTYTPKSVTGTSCNTCPIGKVCQFESNQPIDCAEGRDALAADSYVCRPCPEGQYVLNGVCTPTPDGSFSLHPMMDSEKCRFGSFSSAASVADYGRNCAPLDGTYVTTSGSTTTGTTCPAGSFCLSTSPYSGFKGILPCPAGTYATATTGTSLVDDACLECPAGKYCNGGTTGQVDCPPGYFCPLGTKFSTQFPCVYGTYRPTAGAAAPADCIACPAGQLCPTGTMVAFPCPAGQTCDPIQGQAGCPDGQYNDGVVSGCTACPANSFCPAGSVYPKLCPAGTKPDSTTGKKTLNDCNACPAGSACARYGITTLPADYPPQSGYVYPVYTQFRQQLPCPGGTLDNTAGGLLGVSSCTACPATFACPPGTGTSGGLLKQKCEPGFYCPVGTASSRQYPCPAGTYGTSQTLAAASECTPCSAGNFCPPGSNRQRLCPVGFYCLAGATTLTPCPSGQYNYKQGADSLAGTNGCLACPPGVYCLAGHPVPFMCPVGSYSSGSADTSSCFQCTAGYQCPNQGMSSPWQCPIGTYSPAGAQVCTTCRASYTCTTPGLSEAAYEATTCAGYQCVLSALNNKYDAVVCPVGYYCPAGAMQSIPCPIGTYRDTTGATTLADCLPAPQGKWNDKKGQSLTAISDNYCDPGYKCPAGSTSSKQIGCPPGTFARGKGNWECTACTAGFYCLGLTANPIPCPAGYWCAASTIKPTMCAAGTYGASVKLTAASQCTTCPRGMYCAEPGASAPTGMCNAGHICTGGSISPVPTTTGGAVCPAGGYCELGSWRQKSCKAGFYNPQTGSQTFFKCMKCTPGAYCAGTSLTTTTGPCIAGYYCDAQSTVADQIPAPPGTYTPPLAAGATVGATEPVNCPAGFYNILYKQTACVPCKAGFYCPVPGMSDNIISCPAGNYCPLTVTGLQSPIVCPLGTYNPVTNAPDISWCLACKPGYFCSQTGMSSAVNMCSAGYFCQSSAQSGQPSLELVTAPAIPRWGKCVAGEWCPAGTAYPNKCPVGTFHSGELKTVITDCLPCTAGSYCDRIGLSAPTGLCDAGFFCPQWLSSDSPPVTLGSKTPRPDGITCPAGATCPGKCTAGNYCPAGSISMQPCPAGTYTNSDFQSVCLTCPAGYYCISGCSLPLPCTTGHYCAAGTGTNLGNPCDIGMYQPATKATFCLKCPAGKVCNTIALAAPSGDCGAGYYCTKGAQISNPTDVNQGGVCLKGYYCPVGSGFPIPCAPGYACPTNGLSVMTDALKCAAGYYCPNGAKSITPTSMSVDYGTICPSGHYCPLGTWSPFPCAPGTYRAEQGGTAITDCLPCTAGYYCQHWGTTTPVVCDEGWYCEITGTLGEVSPRPWNAAATPPAGKYCPVGHFCTQGIKQPCGANYYQDMIGQNTCMNCPAGYLCEATVKKACGKMNYCLAGVMLPQQCPNGYYTLNENAQSQAECVMCPAGYTCYCDGVNSAGYCDVYNTVTPTTAMQVRCPAGSYCAAGTFATVASGTIPACTAGYECPEATPVMVPCAPGSACTGGTTKVDCQVGYYCNGGSATATANICQAGYTCVAPSAFPYPCELGTANANSPASPTSTCTACTTGPCNSRGMAVPAIDQTPCGAGFYCPISTAAQIPCDKGYYCPGGRSTPNAQEVCATGYYTADKYQSSCVKCPEGFYCGGNTALNGGIPLEATPCPAGNYCGKGVSFAGILPCPIGSWMSETGTRYKSECYPCIGGFSCATTGLTSSTTTQCTAGNYCPAGSVSMIPCPAGAYCPAGSETYVNCPVGTFSDSTSATSVATCLDCPANYACPSRGMTTSNLVQCGDGFKCVGRAMSSEAFNTQGAVLCAAGSYCSRLTVGQTLCANGYYNPNTGQSACLGCPFGQLCAGTGLLAAATCPTTSYCPAQTSSVNNLAIVCPAGTYNPITNIGSSADCMPCKVGHWCAGGTYSDANVCDETHYCPIGQSAANFVNVYVMGTNIGGTCPEGYTCAQGAEAPTPCPVGTYGPSVKATACLPCPGGKYCDEVALSNTVFALKDKLCDTGYYCTASATVSNPQPGDPTGGICPAGSYCPKGSSAPVPCVAGTYEPRTGSDMCQTCPAGFYCPKGSAQALECINGYCPAGSAAPTLCPDGTYSDSTLKRLAASEDCIICPNTNYCNQGLKQGVCDAGFFCDFGAVSARDTSKLCPAGHYCITAAVLPTRCPDGYYYGGVGATDLTFCQPCAAGNYCIVNDSVARTCPKGYICPALTTEPIPCWVGTYNPWKGASKSSDCMPCPAGSDCSVRGIDDYGKYWCPTGHYCPDVGMKDPPIPCPAGTYNPVAGGANITSCLACPEGNFCQQGSDWPVPCDAGYTCPQGAVKEFACTPGTFCPQLTGTAKKCPKGYYCPQYRTDIYSKCLNGTYCPEASSYPTSCPAGYFGSGATWNFDTLSGCVGCSPGYYSDSGSNTCEMCAAGYLCTGRSTTARPLNAQQGGMPCPAGYWCPQGSYMPIACPLGTYNDKTTIPQLNMCMPCPENTFGNVYAATQCSKCLGQSKADIGSTSCKCTGLNRKYLANLGACVCQSGFMPTDGTEADKDGFSDCQKQVYQRCNTTQERDTNGICRDITDCSKQCDGGKGTIQQNFGICQCESIVTADQLCNVDCQARMVKTTFTADGLLQLYDPVTNKTTTAPMKNTIGQAKCSQKDTTLCKVTPVAMSSSAQGNFQGSYVIPPAIQNSVKSLVNVNLMARLVSMSYGGQRVYEVPVEDDDDDTQIFAITPNITNPTASLNKGQIPWKYVDRKLAGTTNQIPWSYDNKTQNSTSVVQPTTTSKPKTKTTTKRPVPKTTTNTTLNTNDSSVASFISNPVVCTTIGSALLFDSLTATAYPVYDRDNLLNTNENFDYGEFAALPAMLAKTNTSQSFIFTFSQAGVYVFTDSRNSAKEMVIAIMDATRQCPPNSNFSPMTYASLLQVGAFRKDVVTPPDWAFFFAVLISFCILVILAVLVAAYIAKRNWQPSSIPAIFYQVFNYKQAERGDPEDKRAIVSLNTESSSFLFRSQGKEEVGSYRLDQKMKGLDPDSEKKKKLMRSKKDLDLKSVEGLKDKLHKHLKEIRKLHAYNFDKNKDDGEDGGAELQFSDNEESSSDDDELNRQITHLKRMIGNTGAMLRGEGDADQIMDELIRSESGMMDPKVQMEQEEKRRLDRDANAKRHREDLEKQLKDDDEKFRRKIEKENEQAILDLDFMKNKVLEMQVESAYDRGKAFQERLSRDGAKQGDLNDLMDQLEGKMQRVENLMLDDKDRQGDMLARRLEQRRNRRRAMNVKLQEFDETLMKNEAGKTDQKEDIVAALQDELQEEMQKLDAEHEESKKELDVKFEKEKMDALSEFQDRLKNAKGSKNFQDILLEYQTAQLSVDQELAKQKAKEQDKLDRDLKARKAKLRSQAELKRNQMFKNLDENQGEMIDQKAQDKAKIEEALNLDEDRDAIGAQFGSMLNRNLASTTKLADEMERKRRDEEALKQQQERLQRKLQVEAQKETKVADDEVEKEISRIANADEFEPFQALVNERSQLQKKISEATNEDEKQLLLRQMKEIDDAVKNQLTSEKQDQDAALKRKLEARRKKRELAIEQERDLKNKNLSERIDFAIQNSNDFAVTKNKMTKEGLDDIVKKMQMELPPEAIPAALERIIDDKHQKELQDWLLKLYEQKAIELKEEILAMMEEKIAKIQILRKTAEDRCRGLDAIISKTEEVAQKKEYQRRKKTVVEDLEKEINMVEDEFRKREAKKIKEIQGRSMDREAVTLNQMSDLQFKEKREIFEIYLPDTLMKDIYEELGKKEHEDMELYMRELEINKSKKLKQLDEEELLVQAELDKKKTEVSKLSAEERKLIQKLEVEARRVKNLERQNNAAASSQDVIAMMTAQLKQGLDGLSDAYEDERRRQLASIEAKLAERKKAMVSYAEEQKILVEKARLQAEQDRLSEQEKVRELRKRKAQLEVTLGKSQRLVYKQCYSRPLWTFNRKMHEANVQADNLMLLIDEQNSKFQKQVMSELLKKVTDLEDKVSTDVTAIKFKPSKKPKKQDSDTESQTSVAPSVKGSVNLNLQRRFTRMLGGINPGQMI